MSGEDSDSPQSSSPTEGSGLKMSVRQARIAKRRERNRLAQQRYRREARDVQDSADAFIASMTADIKHLRLEKESLASRERRLLSIVNMQQSHLGALHRHEEAWQVEQRLLLTKVVLLLSEVNGRAYSIDEAMSFSFRDWIEVHYEGFLDQLADLWSTARRHPEGAEAEKLQNVMMLQRTSEIELSMNSGINLALLAWNLHYAAQVPVNQQPSERKWAAVLRKLLLSNDQAQRLLQARSSMMEGLQAAQQSRQASYASLNHASQKSRNASARSAADPGPSSCPSASSDQRSILEDEGYRDGIRQLHAALWDERRAIQVYLDIISLQILTPAQEAWLDAVSDTRPWWPDWWTMGNCLAAQYAKPQAPALELLRQPVPEHLYLPSLPIFTPLQLLLTPCTVLGAGANLKRTVLTCAFLTVERVPKQGTYFEKLRMQLPDVQLLAGLSLHEAMTGKYTSVWSLASVEECMTP